MRNKYQEMQDFIVHLGCILKDNEDKTISHEDLYSFIYSGLVSIGIDREKDTDFSLEGDGTFGRLESYFSNRRNTKAFIDPRKGYYLQIQNKPELHDKNVQTIRIYIPQNANNIERSARVLFDQLDNLNISHISKISRNERNDDIVVQVTNIVDAHSVIDFAKGNSQIKAGLLHSNPFCFDIDGMAVSYGRHGNTINTVVASLLTAYSEKMIKENKTQEMFLLDFVDFTSKYFDKHFRDLKDLGEVVADFNLMGAEINTNDNNKRIANIGNIIDLFREGMYTTYTEENFYKDFLKTGSDPSLIEKANAIAMQRIDKPNPIGSQFVGSIDGILLDSVDTFKEKYHISEDKALDIVRTYLLDNNPAKITRDNDIRNRYIKSDFSNKMKRLLELSKTDLETYYSAKKETRTIDALKDAIMETYLKYEDRYEQGFEQVDGVEKATFALKRLIVTGDAGAFTRNNNARANLIKYGDNKIIASQLGNAVNEADELTNACRQYVSDAITDRLEKSNTIARKIA